MVSFSSKHIHVWDCVTGDQIISKSLDADISAITYSHKLHIYFVVTTDFKLHIYNEYLCYVGQFPFLIRLISYLWYDDKEDVITAAGVDGCYVINY